MQKLHFLGALALTLGAISCAGNDGDSGSDTFVTTLDADDEADTSGDGDNGDGDGDGDTATDDATDATDATDTATDDATTGGCAGGEGGLGQPCCEGDLCTGTLECNAGECELPGSDTSTDTTDTGAECNTWDPAMCPMESVIGVMDIEGNFCGCPCTVDGDCPMGPEGTQGACALVVGGGMDPTNCGLICSVMSDTCPAGSTCKTIGQMDPDLGLCTFP